jgi:DNA-binding transcriptional regulator YhcF (GntR family)
MIKKVNQYLKEAKNLGVDKKSALRILKSYLASKKNNQPELN